MKVIIGEKISHDTCKDVCPVSDCLQSVIETVKAVFAQSRPVFDMENKGNAESDMQLNTQMTRRKAAPPIKINPDRDWVIV
jgi:formate hydrogenlyase subunit 6/NADH:ubiquinone oxidoreductase subunit I